MKKPKLLLSIGGGVSGVLVLIAIVFVILGLDGASTAETAREKAIKELERLYKSDPFPSPENIETANENRARAEEWSADLAALLAEDALVLEDGLTGSWFKDQLYARLDALRAAAPLDESGKPVVDPDFGFDFDRYAAVTPDDENVPQLLVQLNLIDHFVRVLYDKGILHLDGVARVAFESGSTGSSESSGRRSGSRGRAGRGGDRSSGAPSVQLHVSQPPAQESPVPYVRERIGLAFRVKEASLLAILDEIDSCWPYVAVSGLRIEKIGDDVRFPDEAPPKKDERVSAGPAVPAAVPQAQTETRSSRFVSGALREQPVQVELYLDFYRMNRPETTGGEDGESIEEEGI